MTISATTQGLKPGVVTSSNRPANPFDGMMIYETDTDKVAVYDSSAWVYKTGTAAPAAPSLLLIETLSPSAAATAQFTTGSFSSTYKFYTVKYALNTTFSVQLRSAGSTITAANYIRGALQNSTGNSVSGGYSSGLTSMGWQSSTASPSAYEGSVDCFDASSSRTQSFTHSTRFALFSGATQAVEFVIFSYNSAQVYDSLLFTATSGTLTGTIKLYGWA
jgi:hypothetical protein